MIPASSSDASSAPSNCSCTLAAAGLGGSFLAIVGGVIGLALAAAVVFAVVITLRAVGADWDEETREDRA